MDRNTRMVFRGIFTVVALRKESVDRNLADDAHFVTVCVALRKESVDRNIIYLLTASAFRMSLSARRAWIEIKSSIEEVSKYVVALRKESVDRNYKERPGQKARPKSLSARRAWIEIFITQIKTVTGCGRSPQGERG